MRQVRDSEHADLRKRLIADKIDPKDVIVLPMRYKGAGAPRKPYVLTGVWDGHKFYGVYGVTSDGKIASATPHKSDLEQWEPVGYIPGKHLVDVWIHPFERSGLGKAPFHAVGMSEYVYRATPEAPAQPGTSCDYCGTGIRYAAIIRGADGKEFKVGLDCAEKTGDTKLIAEARKEKRKYERKLAEEARTALRNELAASAEQRHAELLARLDAQAARDTWGASIAVDMARKLREGQIADLTEKQDALLRRIEALEEGKPKKPEPKAPSQWVGKVGETIELTLTFVHTVHLESRFRYGSDYLHILRDDMGNRFVWKTANYPALPHGAQAFIYGPGRSEVYTVRKGMRFVAGAKVKRHSEYKEEKQTDLSNLKVLDVLDWVDEHGVPVKDVRLTHDSRMAEMGRPDIYRYISKDAAEADAADAAEENEESVMLADWIKAGEPMASAKKASKKTSAKRPSAKKPSAKKPFGKKASGSRPAEGDYFHFKAGARKVLKPEMIFHLVEVGPRGEARFTGMFGEDLPMDLWEVLGEKFPANVSEMERFEPTYYDLLGIYTSFLLRAVPVALRTKRPLAEVLRKAIDEQMAIEKRLGPHRPELYASLMTPEMVRARELAVETAALVEGDPKPALWLQTHRPGAAAPRRKASPKRPSPKVFSGAHMHITDSHAFGRLSELEGRDWADRQKARGIKLDNGFFLNKRAYEEIVAQGLAGADIPLAELDPTAGVIAGAHGEAYIVMPDGEIMLDGQSATAAKRDLARAFMQVI